MLLYGAHACLLSVSASAAAIAAILNALGVMLAVLAITGALVFFAVALRATIAGSRDRVRRGRMTAHEEVVWWLNATGFGLTLGVAFFVGAVLGMPLLADALWLAGIVWGGLSLITGIRRIQRLRTKWSKDEAQRTTRDGA